MEHVVESCMFVLSWVVAVSYTHLDVYKRQVCVCVFFSIIYVFSNGVVGSVGYHIIVFPKCVSNFVCIGIVVYILLYI